MLFPVAPPWYVAQYGLGPAVLEAIPSAAGAARFDELTGIKYFAAFYSRNPNVFGAMPSLHVAYPVIATLAVRDRGVRWWGPIFLLALLVMFSAVYLNHHYIVDVIGGVIAAFIASTPLFDVFDVREWWRQMKEKFN